MANPKEDTPSTVQSTDVQKLLAELALQREENKKLQEKVDILYKSVDHNAIRKNTPKVEKLPTFRVNMFNGKLVMKWDKMVHNKVVPTPQGTHVQQVVKIYFPDDKEGLELSLEDYHSYKTQVEVEATNVIHNADGTFFEFEYEGELYIINVTYIN